MKQNRITSSSCLRHIIMTMILIFTNFVHNFYQKKMSSDQILGGWADFWSFSAARHSNSLLSSFPFCPAEACGPASLRCISQCCMWRRPNLKPKSSLHLATTQPDDHTASTQQHLDLSCPQSPTTTTGFRSCAMLCRFWHSDTNWGCTFWQCTRGSWGRGDSMCAFALRVFACLMELLTRRYVNAAFLQRSTQPTPQPQARVAW